MTTLRPGARGHDVHLLQRLLVAGGLMVTVMRDPISGEFDADTERAVCVWQARRHLDVDGVVGPQTWASFEEALPLTHLAGYAYRIAPHFTLGEFACRHCGTVKLRWLPELCDRLEQLRAHFGAAVHINSGYRCPDHNRAIGGVPDSQHVAGKAADIAVRGHSPVVVSAWAWEYGGFGGVGKYGTFTHVDTGPRRRFNGAY